VNRQVSIIALSLLLLAGADQTTAASTFYKWRDANGKVHVTDDPTKVPDAYREQGQISIKPMQPPVSAGGSSAQNSAGLNGAALFESKCGSCHTTGLYTEKGTERKTGLMAIVVDRSTGFPYKRAEIFSRLRLAADGRSAMLPVAASDAELDAITTFLLDSFN